MGTIVQEYGPIYGEVVNGTVQGRPNGSVYVPLSNTISINLPESSRYVKNSGETSIFVCNSAGGEQYYDNAITAAAEAQDLSSFIRFELFSDAELTTMIAHRDYSAGNFNLWTRALTVEEAYTIVADESYYLVAQLINSGVAVATSETIEVKGWVSE